MILIYIKVKKIELEYKMKSIYILHYPKGKLNVSYGLIKDIIDNIKINLYCNTEDGSSGGPILSLETFKLIGIHYGSNKNNIKTNYGTYIKYAIDLFNTYFKNKNKSKSKIVYKIDKNKKPLNFEVGKKTINKNLLHKSAYHFNCNRETFKLNNNEKNNNYNNYNHSFSSKNKNINVKLSYINHRKITESNFGAIIDKNISKEYKLNASRINNINYINHDMNNFGKNTISYAGNNHQKESEFLRKKSKDKDNFYDISRNYQKNIMYDKIENYSMSLTQNISSQNLKGYNRNNNLKSKNRKRILYFEINSF